LLSIGFSEEFCPGNVCAGDKAIHFFSLFSVVQPTQIFAFKKKGYAGGNEGNDTLFQTLFILI